jgi:hypothetical protein
LGGGKSPNPKPELEQDGENAHATAFPERRGSVFNRRLKQRNLRKSLEARVGIGPAKAPSGAKNAWFSGFVKLKAIRHRWQLLSTACRWKLWWKCERHFGANRTSMPRNDQMSAFEVSGDKAVNGTTFF